MSILASYVKRILSAKVYEVLDDASPLHEAPLLSTRLGCRILLKREDLQPVFSFKLRGAYNKMANLSVAERERGVICSSAGNHAQGVALAAQRLGIQAVVVMPQTTPTIKIDAVRTYSPELILHGNTYDDAKTHAYALAHERCLTFIHAFDDPDVIAGQGTLAMEILRQHPGPIDAIFVAVGGGGMIAGIAVYIKYLRPDIRIIGVESEEAPSMYRSLQQGRRVMLDNVGIFVDGAAVNQVGEENFRIAREYVDEVILVSNDAVCAAIKDIYSDTRSLAEPAGALAIAGIEKYCADKQHRAETLVAVVSGANMNFNRLRYIAERTEIGGQREALFAITIPERPGSLMQLCALIGDRAITEFNYRYSDDQQARIFVGIELSTGISERHQLCQLLDSAGYSNIDMGDNEVAKVHIRHMIGGIPKHNLSEQLYSFYFPERPQALINFLTLMSDNQWNISLFHYRSHGSPYGRVLMGIQVPASDQEAFVRFLDHVGYPYVNETSNEAYRLFLRRDE